MALQLKGKNMAEAQVESAASDLLVRPLLEGHRLVEGGIALNCPKDQLVHPLLQGHRLSPQHGLPLRG